MRRPLIIALLLATSVAGCGDSPEQALTRCVPTQAEAKDELATATAARGVFDALTGRDASRNRTLVTVGPSDADSAFQQHIRTYRITVMAHPECFTTGEQERARGLDVRSLWQRTPAS